MADQWYIARGDQKYGPYASSQLKEFAGSGKILPTDMVTKEGTQKWMPAGNVKGLFAEVLTHPSSSQDAFVPEPVTFKPRGVSPSMAARIKQQIPGRPWIWAAAGGGGLLVVFLGCCGLFSFPGSGTTFAGKVRVNDVLTDEMKIDGLIRKMGKPFWTYRSQHNPAEVYAWKLHDGRYDVVDVWQKEITNHQNLNEVQFSGIRRVHERKR